MKRAPKYCAERGCLELLSAGTDRCSSHSMSWVGTRKRPPGWRSTRARILCRDKWTCYLQLPGICTQHATQVDHIDNLGGDEDGNLAAVCGPCHQVKTRTESREAQLTRQPMQ